MAEAQLASAADTARDIEEGFGVGNDGWSEQLLCRRS